jgi:hypothetical protein
MVRELRQVKPLPTELGLSRQAFIQHSSLNHWATVTRISRKITDSKTQLWVIFKVFELNLAFAVMRRSLSIER